MVCGRVLSGSTLCGTRHPPAARASAAIAGRPMPARLLRARRAPGKFIRNSAALRVAAAAPAPLAATPLSALAFERVGWKRLSAPFRLHPLQMSEDGARVDAQVLGRLGAVAAVPLQHLVDVALLPLVPSLRERQDGIELLGAQLEVVGRDERLVGEHHRLLDAVLQLADVPRPAVALDGDQSLVGKPLHLGAQLPRRAPEE